jgi:hypothetical protein
MNSFLKGFLNLFDWMFPKTLEEQLEDLDDSMQNLYDRMGWGKYKPYPTTAAFNMAMDMSPTTESSTQTIYASKETLNQLLLDMNKNVNSDIKLTKDQEFAIWWLYDREAGRFPDKDTIIVNGINITDTIRELLKDRLFI